MEKAQLVNFAKNAAYYAQASNELLGEAYTLLNNRKAASQKTAAYSSHVLTKLASLTRQNGSPMLPVGKEAAFHTALSGHADTLKILDQMIDAYANIKKAYDDLSNQPDAYGTGIRPSSDAKKNAYSDAPTEDVYARSTKELLGL